MSVPTNSFSRPPPQALRKAQPRFSSPFEYGGWVPARAPPPRPRAQGQGRGVHTLNSCCQLPALHVHVSCWAGRDQWLPHQRGVGSQMRLRFLASLLL